MKTLSVMGVLTPEEVEALRKIGFTVEYLHLDTVPLVGIIQPCEDLRCQACYPTAPGRH